MPDITINFRTENLTRSEREKLLRDIAILKREFREAQRTANDFGQQTKRTLELITQIPNVINPVVHALTAAQDDAHPELQQQETEIATSLQSPRTAIAAQRPTLRAKVATLETQLTALNAQKGVLEEQKTIVQTQKTDFEDQIPVIDKVVVTTKRVNRELREQVDLTERVTAEIERRRVVEGISYQALKVLPQERTNNRAYKALPQEGGSNRAYKTLPQERTNNRVYKTLLQERIVETISSVPSDLLSATYESIVTIPTQAREALQQLKTDTQQNILEIKDSEVLSAREKVKQIEAIEKNAAERRKAIEREASQAKIDSFNRVVDNFIGGIGRMIAEQVKLRVATSLTNRLLGTPQGSDAGIGGLVGSIAPFLAVNPALAIGGGVALGAAALFSGSFDDPVNDALARRAGIQASQSRAAQAATALGRRSAVDLKDNFERGFVSETARQTGSPRGGDAAPVIMNEIKLVIGAQELKAVYEETQRQITTGVIAR